MTPKRFFYLLCGLLAIILVGGGGAYYYASTALAASTQAYSRRLADDSLTDQRISNLDDLQQQYRRLTPLLPVVYNALPSSKDQSTIALQLHDIAAASGMSLDSLNFNASSAPGPTSQTIEVGDVLAIPITFQLKGSYEQLQAFLQQQENLSRYTSITSLAISGSGDNLSFAINLEAFMKP